MIEQHYDIINMTLIILLSIIIYINKYYYSQDYKEHMDMGLFATEDNVNVSTSSSLKDRLEFLEFKLLREKYYSTIDWFKKYLKKRDSDVVYDPLQPPEKRIESVQYPNLNYPYPDPDLQINIRTRGEPDDYILVGILYKDTNVTLPANNIYQLFGRRTYPGSPEWEYYVRGKDIGGLDYKIPINNKQEIYDDTQITLFNGVYKAKIYNYDQPRYNPFL